WYSAVRMLFAMGRQNFLPKAFAKCNRYGQPIIPNLLILAISIGFLAMQSITAFFDLMAFACAICYAMSSISAILLDVRHPEWERPYHAPGGMAMKIASLIISLTVAVFCCIGIGVQTWVGFAGYMGVGVVLWCTMLAKWRVKGKDSTVWMRTPAGVIEY
ncbi:MAG: amino acid permease, partial [Bifidobacterium castoris]|nr:amino acid permease [Bifidobacterium castoris]